MKGVVFTEFLALVESSFGYEMVDILIQESNLSTGGAYTTIGTYPHSEMLTLLGNLSQRTDIPVPDLLRLYSRHFFKMLSKNYAYVFERAGDAFTLLEQIESHIHVEVKKLYPDSKLPYFDTRRPTEHSLEMIYHSERCMADFAEGLMNATLDYYHETATISRENITPSGSSVRFLIEKQQL